MAITEDGLPLGLCAVKFWSRNAETMKGRARRMEVNPTRVPIEEKESLRWLEHMQVANQCGNDPATLVHVGDRENDIFEFFTLAEREGSRFVVRVCHDRCAEESYISEEISKTPVKFRYKTTIQDDAGEKREIKFAVKYCEMLVHPPLAKQSRQPSTLLTFISVYEEGSLIGTRSRIRWNLVTNEPVTNSDEACEKIGWYIKRWQIEMFFKTVKSACGAEKLKLRSFQSLRNMISIFLIISWRVQWLTMLAREGAAGSATVAFSKVERTILDRKISRQKDVANNSSAESYLKKLACLGGYLARSSDPPPGFIVITRGLNKLNSLVEGFELA